MQALRGTIKKNMIAGLLVTVPVAFTYIILEFLITRVDRVMAPVVAKILLGILIVPLNIFNSTIFSLIFLAMPFTGGWTAATKFPLPLAPRPTGPGA